ncbi:MAG TPA: hypothetical protein VF918_08160 [Anaerolineales bacterium]
MSSTIQTPKISTIRLLNDRNLMGLFILAALVVTLMVIFTYAVDRPAVKSIYGEGYMIYRQSEWASVPIPVDMAEAYRIYRQSERASVAIPTVDLNAAMYIYHKSERTSIPVPQE